MSSGTHPVTWLKHLGAAWAGFVRLGATSRADSPLVPGRLRPPVGSGPQVTGPPFFSCSAGDGSDSDVVAGGVSARLDVYLNRW
jgi:hypothetical protein